MITTNAYAPLKIADMSAPRHAPEPEIAARAYEIFLGHGASDGHDLDDWLQAERELIGRRAIAPIRTTRGK